MNFEDYFNPVNIDITAPGYLSDNSILGNNIKIYSIGSEIDDIEHYNIALFGVSEDRNSDNKGSSDAPGQIRNKLYKLYKFSKKIKIVDLGNFKTGRTINDTYYGIRDVIFELLNNKVTPVIIGGTQNLTYANYLAYKKLNKKINIVTVDSKIDFGNAKNEMNSNSYLGKIILEKSKYLFNYTNIGHQIYFVNQEDIDLLDTFFFDSFRLGEIRTNIKEVEPILRDADIFSFDINAVKQSDAPGHCSPSPNGFYGEEACQIAKYAGLSEKLSSFGIYEVNPNFDQNDMTSHLAAQIIWYFIDGFGQRIKENPLTNSKDYKKFIVNLNNIDQAIIFYKSLRSERWWLEVPILKPGNKQNKLIACSYDDYMKACNHEIPDRWLKTFQKIN